MSMLSTQCDDLRLMARLVRDYDHKEISRMLREAADTIESLRDRLQPVPAELDYIEDKSRWHMLFGTPERAARTLAGIKCDRGFCEGCTLIEADCSLDSAVMLGWLRGDA